MAQSNPRTENQKAFERQLEDEKLGNLVLNEVIDYIDSTQGTQLRTACHYLLELCRR
jgi:putative transposase